MDGCLTLVGGMLQLAVLLKSLDLPENQTSQVDRMIVTITLTHLAALVQENWIVTASMLAWT